MKAILAQFYCESNTFNPHIARVAELFRQLGIWKEGPREVRAWASSVHGELAGSLELLAEKGWETAPVFVAYANTSAGRLDREGYASLRKTLREEIRKALPAEAIILHLHGSACAEGLDDTEGDLLAMVRHELGFTGRVVVSLDLHANLTRRMLAHADALTAYRTFPHTDAYETGARAAALAIEPAPIRSAAVKIGMLLPPTSARDSFPEFATLLAQARMLEQEKGILDVSILPVQPWLDVAELGSSIIVTGTGDRLEQVAGKMGAEWYGRREAYPAGLVSMDHILERLQVKGGKPWILADTADAVTGGAAGRGAFVLKSFLPHAHSFPGPVLLQVVDSAAVDAAQAGARIFKLGEQEVPFAPDQVRMAEGRGMMQDIGHRGVQFTLGGAAVMTQGRITVVVCRAASMGTTSPDFYACVGLQPDDALAVQVKSLTGWMAGYAAPSSQGLLVDGPGTTSLNFAQLPFGKGNRKLFPIGPGIPCTPAADYDTDRSTNQ
jgi:microcystin degradation protein MlrC